MVTVERPLVHAPELAGVGGWINVAEPLSLAKLRGKVVSYVPQNPAGSLDPSMRVGNAFLDMIRAHHDAGTAAPPVADALERVGLSGDTEFEKRFPHQLSGGQQQRVCIAVALVCEPPVIVLDEPATGLDVITQARLLDALVRLRTEVGVAMVYVTHDLAVVASFADRIAVMYAGRIVEEGPTREILQRPKHPYTCGLLNSIPDHAKPRRLVPIPGVAVGTGDRPPGCAFAPRCPLRIEACDESMPALREVGPLHASRCLRPEDVANSPQSPPVSERESLRSPSPLLIVRTLSAEHRGRGEVVVAAKDVSFTVNRGECVALVGESGSGKTTIARTIAGLHPIGGGEILLENESLPPETRKRSRSQRQRIQIVFQDPSDALNPRHTVRSAIARPPGCVSGEPNITPTFSRIWLVNTHSVCVRFRFPVSLRMAWDIIRACTPPVWSPIWPPSSARGVSAATESTAIA